VTNLPLLSLPIFFLGNSVHQYSKALHFIECTHLTIATQIQVFQKYTAASYKQKVIMIIVNKVWSQAFLLQFYGRR